MSDFSRKKNTFRLQQILDYTPIIHVARTGADLFAFL